MDRVDSLCQKPTSVSRLGQLLEYGCANSVYPTALLGALAVASHFSHGFRFLVPGHGPGSPIDLTKSRRLARHHFNVGSLFTRRPFLPSESVSGYHASSRRLALPLNDLVLGHSVLAGPTFSVEGTPVWENVGLTVIRNLASHAQGPGGEPLGQIRSGKRGRFSRTRTIARVAKARSSEE